MPLTLLYAGKDRQVLQLNPLRHLRPTAATTVTGCPFPAYRVPAGSVSGPQPATLSLTRRRHIHLSKKERWAAKMYPDMWPPVFSKGSSLAHRSSCFQSSGLSF